jgi:parallel beta-helix repeat protein
MTDLLMSMFAILSLLSLQGCSDDPTSPQTGSISGKALLEAAADHSGITVLLAETEQSTTTQASGQFTLSDIAGGTYTLRAGKNNYGTVENHGVRVAAGKTTSVPDIQLLQERQISTDINADVVWDAGRHFIICGDITVVTGVSLTIEDGVRVYFQNDAALTIEGTLRAVASDSSNRIVFTAYQNPPTTGAWNRLNFKDLSIENLSEMIFCVIEYANTGIICNSASPTIENCYISSCSYTGVLCTNSSSRIENNSITLCQYGIRCEAGSDGVVITKNQLQDNEVCGVACFESSPTISNNRISGSTCGIRCEYHAFSLIEHNELSDNETGVYIFTASTPTIRKNSIHDNMDAIKANNGSYPVVNYNNITESEGWSFYLNNSSTYAEQDVNAQHNWWGTTEISIIEQQIRDKNDVNPTLPIGHVVYDPYLTSPDPTAGVTP